MRDDKLYLIHIGECIDRVESYTQGMTKEALLASSLVQDRRFSQYPCTRLPGCRSGEGLEHRPKRLADSQKCRM
jgi:hypothetical protein